MLSAGDISQRQLWIHQVSISRLPPTLKSHSSKIVAATPASRSQLSISKIGTPKLVEDTPNLSLVSMNRVIVNVLIPFNLTRGEAYEMDMVTSEDGSTVKLDGEAGEWAPESSGKEASSEGKRVTGQGGREVAVLLTSFFMEVEWACIMSAGCTISPMRMCCT